MTEFDLAAERARLSAELRALSSDLADPSPVIKTALPFYGVSISDLRRMGRRWHRDHPGAAPADVAALSDELWAVSIREDMVVACLIHGHDSRARSRFGPRRVDRWVRSIDNWELTDWLGGVLLGPWVGDDPDARLGVLERLVRRHNPWARRLALVGCVVLARRPDASARWEQVSGMVLQLKDDREASIPKAISWVLRSHLRHTPEQVRSFVDEHAAELPAIAVRETRKKLTTGTKTGKSRRQPTR
jgi:3-methyladenine DNA glycosylase AlkD